MKRTLLFVGMLLLGFGLYAKCEESEIKPALITEAQIQRLTQAQQALSNAEAVYAVQKARYEAELAKVALEAKAYEHDTSKVVEIGQGKIGFAPKPKSDPKAASK